MHKIQLQLISYTTSQKYLFLINTIENEQQLIKSKVPNYIKRLRRYSYLFIQLEIRLYVRQTNKILFRDEFKNIAMQRFTTINFSINLHMERTYVSLLFFSTEYSIIAIQLLFFILSSSVCFEYICMYDCLNDKNLSFELLYMHMYSKYTDVDQTKNKSYIVIMLYSIEKIKEGYIFSQQINNEEVGKQMKE